ncbi:isocitrate/isopropylmalate dehydrogenase family protein [Pollutimonas sp. H1-120]|uniref:isocitrate/isopropylmalate dehydrogenase family protein n=1 Tax=Pollutimonas sp. H1-120 TaxID=3148824 RepID=UPI003B52905B
MTKEYSIAVLPGDGIGREVMDAGLAVLQAVSPKIHRTFDARAHAAGAQHYQESGDALPEKTLAACRAADAILFGAMGLPHVRGADGTEIIPQLDIRFALDLYAGVRPIRTFAGLPIPLSDPRAAAIDLVLVRENTEGLFYSRGRSQQEGDEAVVDPMRISRAGTTRICDFAFRLAERRKSQGRPGHVTNVDKANVFHSMAFWRRIFEERASHFPDIESSSAYVDAMALNLVLKPWQYDVLVTENMFGDILSDLVAAMVGGMGMAPSGDIGDDYGLFQPAHGSAPDIAGKGIANPTAMILSVAMMLDWLADRTQDNALADGAQAIERAVARSFSSGAVIPFEFGGSSNTADITKAIIANL